MKSLSDWPFVTSVTVVVISSLPWTIKGGISPANITRVNFTTVGLQIFFKIGGPKWPMEQKMVGHFLKWWAQAYQTNHSWHLGSIVYQHTDTDTWMHIGILTDDYTVKPFLSDHWKQKTNYRLMQGEHSAILLTFIKLQFVIKILFFVFFEWLLKTCFTVLTTYMYFLFCGVRRLAVRCIFFIQSKIFSQLKGMGPLGQLPWKVMGHILKSWDNDPGPP